MPATTRAMARRSCQGQGPPSVSFDESDESSGRRRGHEEVESLWSERHDTPLLNDLIVTELFKYVGGNDLKECRLTCKKWNLRSLPFAGSRHQVSISAGSRDAKNFVELIKSNTLGFPKFEKFFFGPFDTKNGFGGQLLQLCGNTAKEFTLNREYCTHYCDKIEDISSLLQAAPNLVSFTTTRTKIADTDKDIVVKLFPDSKQKLSCLKTLHLRDDWMRSTKDVCPTFCEELFEAAENLSTLTVKNSSYYDRSLDILNMIEKVGRESTIQNLQVDRVTSHHFRILEKMALKPNGLKLKQLDFENRYDQPDWCQFLTLFKDTLVVLRIGHFSHLYIEGPKTIPQMLMLKLLYFHMSEGTNLRCRNFKETFPALENVDLSFDTLKQFNHLMTGDEWSHIRKSSIHCSFPMTLGILGRIIRIFPNLKIFGCLVCRCSGIDVIKFIWTHMIQLEKLTIKGTLSTFTNLDSLVTGIPVNKIKEMEDMNGFFDSLQNLSIEDRKERILMETRNCAQLISIRRLTNLICLDMQLSLEERSPNLSQVFYNLTDLAGYLGFYALKSLHHMAVTNCEFSKSCAEILVKDLGLISRKFIQPNKDDGVIPT